MLATGSPGNGAGGTRDPGRGGMHGHPCPGDQSEPLQVVGAHLRS